MKIRSMFLAFCVALVSLGGAQNTLPANAKDRAHHILSDNDWVTDIWTPAGYDSPREGVWMKAVTVGADCRIEDEIISFDKNGTGYFRANVKCTTPLQKRWMQQSFDVQDKAGKSLFKLGPFTSGELNDATVWTPFTHEFPFDRTKFNEISQCDRRPVSCLAVDPNPPKK